MQAQIAAQIADGTVFRFVHKPASSQRLRLFLDAAVRPSGRTAHARHQPAPCPPPAAPAAASSRPSPGRAPRASLTRNLEVILGAAAGWWVWQHRTEPPPAAGRPPLPKLRTVSAEIRARPCRRHRYGTRRPPRRGSAHDDPRARAALEQAQRSAQGARADQVALYLQLARKRLASGALIDPADDNARTYLESAMALAPDNRKCVRLRSHWARR